MSTVSATVDALKAPANQAVRDSRATVTVRDPSVLPSPAPLAQNSGKTAAGLLGRPFPPGVSGNPGGRPKGLARYVRELVGDDGRRIADFMLSVLDDETERTETRMHAAAWLADRGFGKAPVAMDTAEAEHVQIVVQSAFDIADHAAEGRGDKGWSNRTSRDGRGTRGESPPARTSKSSEQSE